MWKEFKAFIMRGNMLDLAFAVIIGGAFGKIITSLVSDIIMPPIGYLLGKVDFTNLFVVLGGGTYESLDAAKKAGAAVFGYGNFINNIIDFLIVALIVFLLVKAINKLFVKPAPPAAPTAKECPHCCTQIPLNAHRCPNCTSELH